MDKNRYNLEEAQSKFNATCSHSRYGKDPSYIASTLYRLGDNMDSKNREMFYAEVFNSLTTEQREKVRDRLYTDFIEKRAKKELSQIIYGSAIYYKERKARQN